MQKYVEQLLSHFQNDFYTFIKGDCLRFFTACMTLCVSAVFCVARCLIICLSVTLVDCIQTAEDIVKLFVLPVALSFIRLPRWLSGLRHSAHRPERSAGGAGVQSPVGR